MYQGPAPELFAMKMSSQPPVPGLNGKVTGMEPPLSETEGPLSP